MASSVPAFQPGMPIKREWGVALRSLRLLLGDPDDTTQVFRIMRALNGDTAARNYRKLLTLPEGGRLAYRHVELAERFADRAWIDGFAPDTVGAAYRAFIDSTGYSATGLADLSHETFERDVEHPHMWFGRRERDIHDIWHVLTGYQADEPLGEACLVAFSFAQTGGLGWGFIGMGAMLKSLWVMRDTAFAQAVLEGWRRGRRAAWLHAEDYEALMDEPLAAARRRLKLDAPRAYPRAQAALAARGGTGL
jgi:ubiquinone biosynthesis protein COQ4